MKYRDRLQTLQYKMFLLNENYDTFSDLGKNFTIQNVPIKFVILLLCYIIVYLYNTKCSY